METAKPQPVQRFAVLLVLLGNSGICWCGDVQASSAINPWTLQLSCWDWGTLVVANLLGLEMFRFIQDAALAQGLASALNIDGAILGGELQSRCSLWHWIARFACNRGMTCGSRSPAAGSCLCIA